MMPSTLRTYLTAGWTIVSAADLGKRRARQEDASSVLAGVRFAQQAVDVFAVFDGLGGEPRGQEASTAASQGLESVLVAAQSVDEVLPALDKLVDATGGMTTAAIGLFLRARPGNGFVVAAGDSGTYRMAAGGKMQLMVKKDRVHGAITSCLGGGLLTSNSIPLQFGPGETFAFCTDGVDDVAGANALSRAMSAPREGLEAAVRELFVRIDEAGAPDNATIILARWQ